MSGLGGTPAGTDTHQQASPGEPIRDRLEAKTPTDWRKRNCGKVKSWTTAPKENLAILFNPTDLELRRDWMAM